MHNPGHDCRDLNECIRLATADCGCVVEFGCMFGDRLALCRSEGVRIGVESHAPYVAEARKRHPDIGFINGEARDIATLLSETDWMADAVMLIDFIEHLTPDAARDMISVAREMTAKRIVLFVPLGAHPQTKDVFDMGADHWQTHRSTWEPADLESLGFDVALWDGYHHQPGKDSRAAFAIWEPSRS
jgi:hypothetical protein